MAKRNKYAKAHRYGPKRLSKIVPEPTIVEQVKEVIAVAKRKSRAFAKKVNDNVVAFKKNVTPSRVSVVSELNDQPAKTKKVAEPALAWPLRNIYTRQLVA